MYSISRSAPQVSYLLTCLHSSRIYLRHDPVLPFAACLRGKWTASVALPGAQITTLFPKSDREWPNRSASSPSGSKIAWLARYCLPAWLLLNTKTAPLPLYSGAPTRIVSPSEAMECPKRPPISPPWFQFMSVNVSSIDHDVSYWWKMYTFPD